MTTVKDLINQLLEMPMDAKVYSVEYDEDGNIRYDILSVDSVELCPYLSPSGRSLSKPTVFITFA